MTITTLQLVSASEDDTCLLWDLKTTKQCQKLPGGKECVPRAPMLSCTAAHHPTPTRLCVAPQGFGEAAQAGTGGSVERRAKVFGEWWYSAVAFMPDGDTIFAMERSKRGPAVVRYRRVLLAACCSQLTHVIDGTSLQQVLAAREGEVDG